MKILQGLLKNENNTSIINSFIILILAFLYFLYIIKKIKLSNPKEIKKRYLVSINIYFLLIKEVLYKKYTKINFLEKLRNSGCVLIPKTVTIPFDISILKVIKRLLNNIFNEFDKKLKVIALPILNKLL